MKTLTKNELLQLNGGAFWGGASLVKLFKTLIGKQGSSSIKLGESPTSAINRIYTKHPGAQISSDGRKVYWVYK